MLSSTEGDRLLPLLLMRESRIECILQGGCRVSSFSGRSFSFTGLILRASSIWWASAAVRVFVRRKNAASPNGSALNRISLGELV